MLCHWPGGQTPRLIHSVTYLLPLQQQQQQLKLWSCSLAFLWQTPWTPADLLTGRQTILQTDRQCRAHGSKQQDASTLDERAVAGRLLTVHCGCPCGRSFITNVTPPAPNPTASPLTPPPDTLTASKTQPEHMAAQSPGLTTEPWKTQSIRKAFATPWIRHVDWCPVFHSLTWTLTATVMKELSYSGEMRRRFP